jgi:tRNA-specific 2-thiouridylase
MLGGELVGVAWFHRVELSSTGLAWCASLKYKSGFVSARETIVVALSGGVDSATTAALLLEQGHRVIGVTMRLYDAAGTAASAGGRCCGPRDLEDARRVCADLGIPFYVVDYEAEFRARVIDDFVDAYLAGATPNPCARCNQFIKFTPLLQRARALGADALATGHSARLEPRADGAIVLRRGVDEAKDQSYFLFSMPKTDLAAIRFPLGALTKDEVRQRAESFGLPNAHKRDSQEICFVPDGDYAGFVERTALARGRRLPPAGEIRDPAGEVVGHHAGTHRFTLGQRRGLGAVGRGEPAYVTSIDAVGGVVTIGPRAALGGRRLRVAGVEWFAPPPAHRFAASVQIRHRQRPVPAAIEVGRAAGEMTLELEQPIAAAPGQAAVVYAGDTVLGGGWVGA